MKYSKTFLKTLVTQERYTLQFIELYKIIVLVLAIISIFSFLWAANNHIVATQAKISLYEDLKTEIRQTYLNELETVTDENRTLKNIIVKDNKTIRFQKIIIKDKEEEIKELEKLIKRSIKTNKRLLDILEINYD